VHRGLQSLDAAATSVDIPHISAMELNGIRRVAARALDELRMFGTARGEEEELAGGTESHTQQNDGDDERSARLLRAVQRGQRTA
jgi:hypothetical protein